VPPKNTGIAPGPMLTEFKENKIPTKIDQGTIWILKETTPVKKGEPISAKLAALLGKLDIKPIEAKIILNSALSEGILFAEEETFSGSVSKFDQEFKHSISPFSISFSTRRVVTLHSHSPCSGDLCRLVNTAQMLLFP